LSPRTAAKLKGKGSAITPACTVQHRRTVIHARSSRGQRFAVGADVDVAVVVIGEVVAWVCAVAADQLVEHGQMKVSGPASHSD